MALEFGGAGAFVKAFLPAMLGLASRAGWRMNGQAAATPGLHAASIVRLSPEAEAALAALDLPPDGPLDAGLSLRPRLAPDVAARNFVAWARALDLAGTYSRQAIYALYCEFSEVDQRPPLRDTRFLEALAETEGIRKEQVRLGEARGRPQRTWRWIIAPASACLRPDIGEEQEAQTESAPIGPQQVAPDVPAEEQVHSAPKAALPTTEPLAAAPAAAVAAASGAATVEAPAAKSAMRPLIVLPRFTPDQDHPFSPAGLRERQKNLRRARLNAAASRKQRGAVRRAA